MAADQAMSTVVIVVVVPPPLRSQTACGRTAPGGGGPTAPLGRWKPVWRALRVHADAIFVPLCRVPQVDLDQAKVHYLITTLNSSTSSSLFSSSSSLSSSELVNSLRDLE